MPRPERAEPRARPDDAAGWPALAATSGGSRPPCAATPDAGRAATGALARDGPLPAMVAVVDASVVDPLDVSLDPPGDSLCLAVRLPRSDPTVVPLPREPLPPEERRRCPRPAPLDLSPRDLSRALAPCDTPVAAHPPAVLVPGARAGEELPREGLVPFVWTPRAPPSRTG